MKNFRVTVEECEPDLAAQVRRLQWENQALRTELDFLRSNPAIAKGIRGESLIASMLGGTQSRTGAGHDLVVSRRLLVEVKYSSLLAGVNERPLRRWVWSKLFGEAGQKQYDRLLLIGDVDRRHLPLYADPSSPYVFFDLPYAAAVDLAGGIKPGRESKIHLTTNPATVRSANAKILFAEFQVTRQELRRRYPKLRSAVGPRPNQSLERTPDGEPPQAAQLQR
jgi:hypothetical protein